MILSVQTSDGQYHVLDKQERDDWPRTRKFMISGTFYCLGQEVTVISVALTFGGEIAYERYLYWPSKVISFGSYSLGINLVTGKATAFSFGSYDAVPYRSGP